MSTEDLEKYETEWSCSSIGSNSRQNASASSPTSWRRSGVFYLANQLKSTFAFDGEVYFEVEMHDAGVWDM